MARNLKLTTKTTKRILKLVPDTSVLIEGVLSKRIISKTVNVSHIIIHEASMAELESQANKGREVGELGLEEVKRLRELSSKYHFTLTFKGERPKDFEIRYAKSGEIDSIIRTLAAEEKATLVTADIVQSKVAESKGIPVMLFSFEPEKPRKTTLEKMFDVRTMSVHLKAECTPHAKKGMPGAWTYEEIGKKVLSRDDVQNIAKEIIEDTKRRKDGFIELDRRGSTILQMGPFRVVITRPPLADGYEITAARPIKKMALKDYKLSQKLIQRMESHAEGMLIAGPPGHGKSTFAQALAEYYFNKNKVVKTIEAPRDLILPEGITQYALSHGSPEELHDIILLSRPDYTFYDEIRNNEDFNLFSDLRLSGVGMVGVVHATRTIEAIHRFLSRLDLGVVPHVVDTVIFIRNGMVDQVLSLSMDVKVPHGMHDQDLARPVVSVHDFETGALAFEMYTFGEQTVVIPVGEKRDALHSPPVIGAPHLGSLDAPQNVMVTKHAVFVDLGTKMGNKDVDVIADGEYILTARTNNKGTLRINKGNPKGKQLLHRINKGAKITVTQLKE
ncbi:MAG: PINc/VapC family ATPase [Candidatus Woesearchaeota archaeon]